MFRYYKILLCSILLISFGISEYQFINAFPNLTFVDPVGIHHAGDGTNRLFVVEQEGRIKVFNNNSNTPSAQTFLDIRSIVDQDGGYTEEGLLGLAFHPNYSENGYFYVNYTDYGPKRNVIARYSVDSDNPNEADYFSSEIILEVNQPYNNHNGGQMGFGSDGYLYISFGDGGSAGDPQENGQDLSTLLGTIIRIDVDNPSDNMNYSIPSDNPFIDTANARAEIYAYGLRNVWRFSWDPVTDLLWAADVGQNAWEEIDIISSGLNYGWNEMEASHCYPPGSNCNPDDFELPIWEYELYVDGVCSVTGGYVYRGSDIFSLRGKYIYGDWCTGNIWSLEASDNGNYINEDVIRTDINITSFGVDQNNELFFCGGQRLYKLTSNEGDLNNDGLLNVLDVILLVNLILAQGYSEIADINGDNILNVLDIISLINIILEQ
ncbi:MAG: glucose sorbosone dehydrogenase [Candidatus Marinimicrobia bacterium]|nr:glucose sorbosone dehydrogenase [Candidatus Neomarinimicrobiota bacterium]|tara:strand:- start:1168 stop:2472 length:1305 start_codon:yes stop_codon:yes gene_type:complete